MRREIYARVKRVGDVVLCGAALGVLAPFLALTAASVRLDSRGPMIFKQERLGLRGRAFVMYKFRTMHVGAESGGVYERAGDRRVTRVGRLLRRTSIDELPQLVNILKGDMSIVGPRPPLTYHPWPLEEYSQDARQRFEVRPGVTGMAQVSGRKSLEWPARIEHDVRYVELMSLQTDIGIVLRTIQKVLLMSDNINTSKTAQTGFLDPIDPET